MTERSHLGTGLKRGERLQIMLGKTEVAMIDEYRFTKRMRSRSEAVRTLLKRGFAEGTYGHAESSGNSAK